MGETSMKTANLLFELGTEELPPVALKRLAAALTQEFIKGLDDAALEHGEVTTYCSPRRLALLVRDCGLAQPDRDVERRGPALAAAYGDDGKPTKAAEGFARSCGVSVDQLQKLETDKGSWLVYNVHQPGQRAAELLPTIAENSLNRLPIPKRMRWGIQTRNLFARCIGWCSCTVIRSCPAHCWMQRRATRPTATASITHKPSHSTTPRTIQRYWSLWGK